MNQAEQYVEQGYTIVPQLYTPATVAEWKAVINRRVRDEGGADAGVAVWKTDRLDDLTRRLLCTGPIVGILQSLIGPRVAFLSVKPVFKDGQTRFGSPWHQDWLYWKGAPKLSAWIALDEATPDNGCLKVIPGSHTQVLQSRVVDNDNAFVNRTRDEELAGREILDVPLKAGDALFFRDLLLHASYPNTSGRDRWSIIPTYRDAGVPDDSTVWDRQIAL